ncbi:MAG: DUF5692 family protein [Methylobacter sp.]
MDIYLSPQTVVYTGALFFFLLLCFRVLAVPALCFLFFSVALSVLTVNAGLLNMQFFTWIKTYTLVISLFIVIATPRVSGKCQDYFKRLIHFILILNIAEAAIFDAIGMLWINACVGLSLIATLNKISAISVEEHQGRRYVAFDLPWCWIVAYTVWDITFVYGHYPTHYFDHLAVLLAPVAIALIQGKRQTWFEARAITLTLYVITIIYTLDFFQLPWIPAAPVQPVIYQAMLALSVLLGGVNLISWAALRKQRLNAQ